MAGKQKLKKTTNSADSGEDSEHELFYYANDRIKLMKEVLKLIKPKKIKSIAPDFMKSLDIDEINSMLLEELLGISNKRLKRILNGENVDGDTSSSDSEQEQKHVDIISLDDISDTDDEFGLGSINSNTKNFDNKSKHKEKSNKRLIEIKNEKGEHSKKKEVQLTESKVNNDLESDKLMNVLEILELQARARAIRSQLALETINKKTENNEKADIIDDEDDVDAVIVHSPRNEEIIITSESEEEKETKPTNKPIEKSLNFNLNSSHQSNKDKKEESSLNIIKVSVEKNAKTSKCNSDNETGKKSTNHQNDSQSVKPNDFPSIKSNNSNNSIENVNKEDANIENIAGSDSDNDVINLDSEDIENV